MLRLLTLTALAAALLGANPAPAAASTCYHDRLTRDACSTTFASPRYVGWVYLELNYCAPGEICHRIYRRSMSAWSWTGSAWRPSSLNGGWVYVYPYTGEWRWAWTQSSGWVAVNSGRFEVRGW